MAAVNHTLLTQIDALKVRLDKLRPLSPDLVDNLREVYDIRLTYSGLHVYEGQ